MRPSCRHALRAVASVALLTLACGPPEHRASWEGGATRAQTIDLVRLHQLRDAIDSAWERRQVDRLGRALADDVVFVPPRGPVLTGRAAVLDWFERTSAGHERFDTYVSESIHPSDDWAVEVWSIDRLVRREGRSHRVRLKGMHVYRRADDGGWLLARRIWNVSPGHTTAVPVGCRAGVPEPRESGAKMG